MHHVITVLSEIKRFITERLGFPPFVVLMIVGLAFHLMTNKILGKHYSSPWGIVGPLILGILIESVEIWDVYIDSGSFSPSSDPLAVILMRHSLDVLQIITAPVALTAIWHWIHRS